MERDLSRLKGISAEQKPVLRSESERAQFGNNSNDVEEKEESVGAKKPWVFLIERLSENGHITIETTSKVGLDPSLEEFLKLEAASLAARAEELRVLIKKAPERHSHGKKRAGRVVRDDRKSLNKELSQALEYKEIFSGKRKDPIKIIVSYDGEVTGWEFPKGSEALWAQYVRDENPQILGLPSEDRALVQRGFLLRHADSLRDPDAKKGYYSLLGEIKGRTDLEAYMIEFTRRFAGR